MEGGVHLSKEPISLWDRSIDMWMGHRIEISEEALLYCNYILKYLEKEQENLWTTIGEDFVAALQAEFQAGSYGFTDFDCMEVFEESEDINDYRKHMRLVSIQFFQTEICDGVFTLYLENNWDEDHSCELVFENYLFIKDSSIM